MKSAVLFCFIVLVGSNSLSQIQTHPIKSDEVTIVYLKKTQAVTKPGSPVRKIHLIDNRDDTSCLGYDYLNEKHKVRRQVFKRTASVELNEWISSYLYADSGNSTGHNLLICLKNLRISSELSNDDVKKDQRFQKIKEQDKGIFVKMEFYLEKDSFFYPLYRFDSVFIFEEKINDDPGKYVSGCVAAALAKMITLDVREFLPKRKLSLAEINSRNNRNLPILSGGNFQKGVYANFGEFKNNAPSILDYEYYKGSLGDILYIGEKDKQYPARNVWGFCDGIDIFINSGDKYSKLVRTGNTFYFEGIKNLTREVTHDLGTASLFNMATNSNRMKTKYKMVLKYYQLNMENGAVY